MLFKNSFIAFFLSWKKRKRPDKRENRSLPIRVSEIVFDVHFFVQRRIGRYNMPMSDGASRWISYPLDRARSLSGLYAALN